MAEPHRETDQLRKYLGQLTTQGRSRLLAELERLHLIGQDIPHSEALIATLRAEFRNTGERHYRIGNPSRYFFEPLEPVLVDEAPELANGGQIARGSLAPIWALVTEKLLPSMATDYIENTKEAILAEKLEQARQMAGAFQKKVLSYFDGVLGSSDGVVATRAALEVYTSSRASFDDLKKMLDLLRALEELSQLGKTLPAKIPTLNGEALSRLVPALDRLRRKRPKAVSFALTLIARRLDAPWELMQFATALAPGDGAPQIAAGRYGIAVSMVLDQIAQKHRPLVLALKQNGIARAKEILQDIYKIEDALRTHVPLEGADWGRRLDEIMAKVQETVKSEIDSIPVDHRHLTHVLESPRLRSSQTGSLRGILRG